MFLMKKVWSLLPLLPFAFVACSDSTISTSKTAEDRYIVTDIMAYEFTDAYLVQTQGQCEEEDGKLVWSKNGQQYQSPASLNKSTDSLRVAFTNGISHYAYEGNSFPIGLFRSTETEKNTGIIFGKNGTMQFITFYGNECLIDDINLTIKPEDKRIDCNTILSANGTHIKVLPPEGTIFRYEYSAGNVTCSVETKLLFPYYEKDCRAAYDEFVKDTSTSKVFEFSKYKTTTTIDSSCFKDLAVELAAPQQN